jgi:hypothetical protein
VVSSRTARSRFLEGMTERKVRTAYLRSRE